MIINRDKLDGPIITQEIVTKSEINELKEHIEAYNTKNYNAIKENCEYIDLVNSKVDSMAKFQKTVLVLLAIILTVITVTMFMLHSRNRMPRTVIADKWEQNYDTYYRL